MLLGILAALGAFQAGAAVAERVGEFVLEPDDLGGDVQVEPWALQDQIGGVRGKLGRLSREEAEALLQGGLVGLNRFQLRGGAQPISRALHEGRVVYDRNDPDEHWRSIREIWEAGGRGDCEDLAAAVAAERTEAGMPSEVAIVRVRQGLSHAVVRDLQTGRLLDPSLTGGMGRERVQGARRPPVSPAGPSPARPGGPPPRHRLPRRAPCGPPGKRP